MEGLIFFAVFKYDDGAVKTAIFLFQVQEQSCTIIQFYRDQPVAATGVTPLFNNLTDCL
jgi:hypothetical protein